MIATNDAARSKLLALHADFEAADALRYRAQAALYAAMVEAAGVKPGSVVEGTNGRLAQVVSLTIAGEALVVLGRPLNYAPAVECPGAAIALEGEAWGGMLVREVAP